MTNLTDQLAEVDARIVEFENLLDQRRQAAEKEAALQTDLVASQARETELLADRVTDAKILAKKIAEVRAHADVIRERLRDIPNLTELAGAAGSRANKTLGEFATAFGWIAEPTLSPLDRMRWAGRFSAGPGGPRRGLPETQRRVEIEHALQEWQKHLRPAYDLLREDVQIYQKKRERQLAGDFTPAELAEPKQPKPAAVSDLEPAAAGEKEVARS